MHGRDAFCQLLDGLRQPTPDLRLDAGRIAEGWVTDDALSLFIQLGLVPMPGASGA